MADVLSAPARAKINLFLRVLAAESSGYHGIETLFQRIELADGLEVERVAGAGTVALQVDGADLGPVEANLAHRAARLVLDATGNRFGIRMTLTKRIPAGAGLGGGSADAATALELVNQLAGNAIPRPELLHLASRLGADIPYLLSGASLALGWGHGERLLQLDPLPPLPLLLVIPPVAVATAEAYGWVDRARSGAGSRGALLLDAGALARWSDVARMAGNDFESAVFGREPRVREAFEALARTGPMLCRMSGSGSTVFAGYRSVRERDDAQMMLGRKLGRVVATTTV